MDDGFSYRIPEDLRDRVAVGSQVRVPLGGRRLAGYVVDLRTEPSGGHKELKDLAGLRGDLPLFDRRLLETLRWLALHYVAPLAAVLGRAGPPNLPRFEARTIERIGLAGERIPPRYLMTGDEPVQLVVDLVAKVTASGRTVAVIAPTAVEARAIAGACRAELGDRVLVALSEMSADELTRTWVRAVTESGWAVIGTRGLTLWPLGDLAAMVVVEEGRKAMKEKQTPTLHVREVTRRRGAVERFALTFLGRVPTTEILASGVGISNVSRRPRLWPLVEVVDRNEEAPGAGLLTERVRLAMRMAAKEGEPVLLFTHRRGFAPAARCASCRKLRLCPTCRARPDPGDRCPRCGAELGPCIECGGRRFEPLGAGVGRVIQEARGVVGYAVGHAGGNHPVQVGTEADLVTIGPMALAVVVDADGLIMAPNYRAGEDALRLMARVASTVVPGRRHRLIVQSSQPEHPVLAGLRSGEPLQFLRSELESRRRMGFPPFGELLVVEARQPPEDADGRLREVAGEALVLGPASRGDTERWLIQGGDLSGVRIGLRQVVQHLRDSGARIHIDVDPVDL